MLHVMCGTRFMEDVLSNSTSIAHDEEMLTRWSSSNVCLGELDGIQLLFLQGCEAARPVRRIGPLGSLSFPDEMELDDGESLLKLITMLLDANVASVIVSLWKIPDVDRIPFLLDFYERLLRGDSRRQALAGAQACAGLSCYVLYG